MRRLAALALLVPLAAAGAEAPKGAKKGKPKGSPAAAAAAPKPARAPRPAPPEPPPFVTLPDGPRVTLAEAIRTTLERNPDVEAARLEVRRARGLAQEAAGAFDPVLFATPSFQRQKTALTGGTLAGEVARRETLRDQQAGVTRLAADIATALGRGTGVALSDCRGTQLWVSGFSVCSGQSAPTDTRSFELLRDARNAAAAGTSTGALEKELQDAVNRRLTRALAALRGDLLPDLTTEIANLGDLPRVAENDTASVDLRLLLPARNGWRIGPVFQLSATRYAFSDKPDSPAYGGAGVPTLYTATAALALELPLLRGGGKTSVAAEERAARRNADAAIEELAQTGADAALRTTIAYWNLAAAQELEALLVRGASSQKRIGDVSRSLAQADELPRADLAGVDAATAEAESATLQAVREVASARVELARAMGLDVARFEECPYAADPLPVAAGAGVAAAADVDALAAGVAERRSDVRAARARAEAAKILEDAARHDLAPRLDLSLQVGWSSVWDDGSTSQAWDPSGYGNALTGKWTGPSVLAALTFQLPFGNHAQRGRLLAAEAFRAEAETDARDRERRMLLETRALARSVAAAAPEARAREEAGAEWQKTVGTSSERFRAGQMPLLDALFTERTRLQALADLVAARQTLALRTARLRWAAGTLVPVTREGNDIVFGGAPGR